MDSLILRCRTRGTILTVKMNSTDEIEWLQLSESVVYSNNISLLLTSQNELVELTTKSINCKCPFKKGKIWARLLISLLI